MTSLLTPTVNTRRGVVQIPPEQQNDYRTVLDAVARLAHEAKTKSPLFNVVCGPNEVDKTRCQGLIQLSSICSAAVMKAKNNQPCLTLKELDSVRVRLKTVLDESNAHLTTAMNEPRLRMRLQMLTSELGKTSNGGATASAAAAAVGQSMPTAPGQLTPLAAQAALANAIGGSTPLQQGMQLSPEVVNNLIKRPLKQEDLKPPPPPKVRKVKVEQSPKAPAEDTKLPRTPATQAATPAAEVSTPSGSKPRAPKRKASTTTPKTTKKPKATEETKPAPSPAVTGTPAAAAPTPQATEGAPSVASAASTPAPSSGYTGNALAVSRSKHSDYFAAQNKTAEAERENSAAFFSSRQTLTSFDGDLSAAVNVWTEAQLARPAPPMAIPGPPSTDDALADQSWHDFINEQNFDPDEQTPLLTRCRSLDTDPECSPREGDLLGRSPLVAFHVATAHGAHDPKLFTARRVPLMSPSARPYNGMLFVEDDSPDVEPWMT